MSEKYFLDRVKKPCPFCGSNELRAWEVINPQTAFVIECQNCITQFSFISHVAGSALELWDDRREIEKQSFNYVLDQCINLLNGYKSE